MKRMREVPGDKKRELGQRPTRSRARSSRRSQRASRSLLRAAREAELSGPMIDASLPGPQRAGRAPASDHAGHLPAARRVRRRWASTWPTVPRSICTSTTSTCSAFRPITRRPTCRTASTSRAQGAMSRQSLLRTHTSTIQIREMLKRKPPLAVVAPGAVFRRDDDATHSPMFFQIEGFIVDEGITFAHLKGVLTRFLQALFGADVPVRFRPSYFPFVEPGGEIDIYPQRSLAGGARLRDDPSRGARERRLRPASRSAASRSAWASIAWRCCCTASTTSSSSTKTTCGCCRSSEDHDHAGFVQVAERAVRLRRDARRGGARASPRRASRSRGRRRYGDLPGVVVAEVRAQAAAPQERQAHAGDRVRRRARDSRWCAARPTCPSRASASCSRSVGAKLPNGMEIGERKVAGVVSRGMICSEVELDIGAESDGIVVLRRARSTPGPARR